jgi:hypothetical protein
MTGPCIHTAPTAVQLRMVLLSSTLCALDDQLLRVGDSTVVGLWQWGR